VIVESPLADDVCAAAFGEEEGPLRVATAEMWSVTATRRQVRSRSERSRRDCRKSGMWRIATAGRMDGRNGRFRQSRPRADLSEGKFPAGAT
jgi:hypothetical protein